MRSLPILVLWSLASAGAASASGALHSCGTSVHGDSGTGWCSGSGAFRLIVACEDGEFARSSWLTVSGDRGVVGVSCVAGSRAVGAEIEEEPAR
ncbi:hypothetical protein [Saccharothrix syringae]|uniref:hypothetical protein n=1 Tax=Saccharothrix syringae TaxID=103733 RepID=UPI00052553DF|nr:hypothetical protein [Saccharothrix syringae]